MDLPHIQVMILFLLVAKTISVQPLVLHHLNQKVRESSRLIRSATTNRSLDQTRALSVVNCYGSTCVINEEFCDETKQGCAMCSYDNGECTAKWDCFNFCSEKAAQEICEEHEEHLVDEGVPKSHEQFVSGEVCRRQITCADKISKTITPDAMCSKGYTEVTETPWWSYVLIAILVASVVTNFGCILIPKCKSQALKRRGNSEKGKTDKDENRGLVSNQREDIPLNITDKGQVPKEPIVPEKVGYSESDVQGHPIAHPADNLYPLLVSPTLSKNM